MKILFDQGTPVPLRQFLPDHDVSTAYEEGWSQLSNGALLQAAEAGGFQLLITTDQNLRFQQNLAEYQIAIAVILTTSWPRIRERASEISKMIAELDAGQYVEIRI